VPLEVCVFANFFMGLREAGPETGRFPGATVVALTHPSRYNANVRRRRYRGLLGSDAEQSMIADALLALRV
jgi:hypothetical protein